MNVYLLDDDDIFQFIFERIINQLDTTNSINYEFHMNGNDLLASIAAKMKTGIMPDKCVFLVDLNMPIMNGWQFIAELFKLLPNDEDRFKIYIMSSSISDQDISKAKDNPKITGYIVKPIMKSKLQDVLFGSPKDFILL